MQTLIAFAIDIALYAFVHHEIGKLPDVNGHTNTSAGAPFSFYLKLKLNELTRVQRSG
jgi:hypothetical protein